MTVINLVFSLKNNTEAPFSEAVYRYEVGDKARLEALTRSSWHRSHSSHIQAPA